jgi:Uma2 family endonuclease
MEKEKKKNIPYESSSTKPSIVKEPFVMYGTLELDVTKRYTYADYLNWLDDKRRELINGFIHLMSGPMRRHARISLKLSNRIDSFIEMHHGRCHVYHAPFDVRLPLYGSTDDDKIYDVVQPDICVICDLTKLDDKGCIGAPDLVVEVLSPSTLKYDWNYKFNLYEAAGVREYWIVDPNTKIFNVFLLQADGKYDLGTVYEGDQKVPVHILEGLEIDLNELFKE